MMLYMIRHGETEWNKERRVQGHMDIPLNDYGRRLARETAEGMKDIRIDLGYTSPLSRARETAQIILSERGVPLYDEERIKEMCFGSYEGLCCSGEKKQPESELFNKFFTDTENYVPPEGAESISQLYERTGDFLSEMCQQAENREDLNVLLSTHGAAMTALLNRIKGNLSVRDFWRDEVPPNCAVTMVEIKNGKTGIVKENVIFHTETVKKWKIV